MLTQLLGVLSLGLIILVILKNRNFVSWSNTVNLLSYFAVLPEDKSVSFLYYLENDFFLWLNCLLFWIYLVFLYLKFSQKNYLIHQSIKESFIVLLCLFILSFGWLFFYPIFGCIIGFTCLYTAFFLNLFCFNSKDEGNFVVKLYWYLHTMYYSPKALKVLHFWSDGFWQRKPEKRENVIWEIPLLIILTFYSLISSRFVILQRFIIIRGFYLGYLYQDWTFFVVYIAPIFILTLLVYLPPFEIYLKDLYGDNVLTQLGWNAKEDIVLEASKPILYALLGAVGLAFIGGSELAASKAYARYLFDKDRINYTEHYQQWLEWGVISGLGPNHPGKPTPPLWENYENIRLVKKGTEVVKEVFSSTKPKPGSVHSSSYSSPAEVFKPQPSLPHNEIVVNGKTYVVNKK